MQWIAKQRELIAKISSLFTTSFGMKMPDSKTRTTTIRILASVPTVIFKIQLRV
jgi:hypothetical protein